MQPTVTRQVPVIAVVDDDGSVRRSLRRFCRTMGFDPRVFASAEDFLPSVDAQAYDCLILDLRMPGMDGLELQQRLLAMRADVPIILITAHDEPASRARGLAAGAVAYLNKPVTNAVLLGAIRQALKSTSPTHRLIAEDEP
jgi:FixJ family two-component response regulator